MTARNLPGGDGAEADLRRARRLAWLSLAYLCSTVTLLILVAAGSQALKTEFVGDALSMIPPALFLIGNRIGRRPPDPRHPFGYERAVSAGHLGSAFALLAVGLYLLADSAMKLATGHHPVIGGMPLFGRTVWIGWLGLAALLYSALPAFFLGRAKRKLGERLHDKVLMADAQINAADWQSAGAAMLGLVGLAYGFWWADAAAAAFISIEIIRDGVLELRSALGDIMDRRPQTIDGKEPDPLPGRLQEHLRGQDWVDDVVVRVREVGRTFSAQAFVIPAAGTDLLAATAAASDSARGLDERLREVSIMPVPQLTPELEAIRPD